MAALLALASLVGVLGLLLRQPLIVSFIAVGIVAGPDVLGLVQSTEHIELLAEIGIAVLLFLVGLKLDVQLVRTLGAVALATGLGQVAFTSIVGFFICLALGLDMVTSAYVAVALTFSSTIIIVKLLSDKREIDSLHGRIALGFLIVQDIAVVLAMVVLSAYGVGTGHGPSGFGIAGVIAGGVLLLVSVALFIRYGAEPLLARIATMPELMVTFAIAWAVLLASVSDWLGFGKELGGLLGGVSLASTSFREAIASRLSSLRDFLLLFFFIGLGSRLDLGMLGEQLGESFVLALFVLIGNPLIVLAIMGYMGYRKRTGFLAGLTVAQISEFSLIFMAMGLSLGHVRPEAMGLVTLVGLVTITLSTYMIVYSQTLYALVEPLLAPFERAVPYREESAGAGEVAGSYDVILFGLGRYGREIAKGLTAQGMSVLGVDFDPEAMDRWRKRGHPGLYGDVGDPEFLSSLPLRHSRWVVVAIPAHPQMVTHHDVRLSLLHALREMGFAGRVVLTSTDSPDTRHLLHAGADLVISPFKDAASRAVERIVEAGASGRPTHALAGAAGKP
ncbi:sodium:proton exchanger [Azospirillum thermophilum]|uniref:Sodium:proton exchanger n=2 Tax=Azospirillum thermophilum TaxID=2202148 RepID=A0A2S2CUA2_9PROT|nr:sodium:proton exchanger [Azospirillum thermophilum]